MGNHFQLSSQELHLEPIKLGKRLYVPILYQVYFSLTSISQNVSRTQLCAEVYWCIGIGFIKGILRGVRCTKSLRVLFLHRRPPSWTTLVLYSRAVFIFNEPALWFTVSTDT
jgi:hypothetical protein